jgi:hypothetical protein
VLVQQAQYYSICDAACSCGWSLNAIFLRTGVHGNCSENLATGKSVRQCESSAPGRLLFSFNVFRFWRVDGFTVPRITPPLSLCKHSLPCLPKSKHRGPAPSGYNRVSGKPYSQRLKDKLVCICFCVVGRERNLGTIGYRIGVELRSEITPHASELRYCTVLTVNT